MIKNSSIKITLYFKRLKQRNKKIKQRFSKFFLCFILVSVLSSFLISCKGGYSFTGASINADTKTFKVETFLNRSSIIQPTLASSMTYALINKIRSGTNLKEVEDNADVSFSGTIVAYSVTPAAISSNDKAAKNRLTIAIRVKYVNHKDSKSNFETTFSRYKDYDSGLSLSSVETSLIKEIDDELVDDIFTKAFVNW
jgi:hypothetical protein